MRRLNSFIRDLGLWPSRLHNPDWDGRGAGMALMALVVAFYVDKLVLGPWAAIRVHDVFDSDFLRYEPLGKLLFQHGFFSWYPHYAGGMPAYVWHHTPFYVLCVLAGVLPLWLIYGVLWMGLMAAAGWGMFRLLKERMEMSARNAFLGAAFFECASQIQLNNAPEMVFDYAFPLFYVWTLDVWENWHQPRRILKPLLGVGAMLLLSYPILTLPYFALLQGVLLALDAKVMRNRRTAVTAFFGWGILWSGYVLGCAPVFYALLGYSPEAARHFDAWRLPDLQGLREFLTVLGQQTAIALSRSMTFAPVMAAAGLLAVSRRVRRYFWIWAAVLVVSCFFDSPLARVFAGTLFARMDLVHFIWVTPFAAALVAVVGWDEMKRRPGYEARYHKLLAWSAALLIVLTCTGVVSKRTLTVNLCLVALLWIANRRGFDGWMKFLSGFSIPLRRIIVGSLVVAVLAICVGLFRVRPCEAPVILLFGWLAWLFWRAGAQETVPMDEGRRRTRVVVMGTLLVLFSVRMFKFGGDESENTPYSVTMDNYSFLQTLRAQDPGPWRAGTVGSLWPSILVHYGWEAVDSRGPIANRRYKDVFKRIVMPQLTEKKAEDHFDAYWYDLSLMNGNRKMEFRWPLLALANVKHLVSSEPSPQLERVSESVREEPLDSQMTLHAWAGRVGAVFPFLKKPLQGKGTLKSCYIYTLKDTLPRGFLVRQTALLKSDVEVLDALSRASVDELKDRVYFSGSDTSANDIRPLTMGKAGGTTGSSADTCELVHYSPDRLEYRLSTSTPGALVVSNNYNSHWKARVNGISSRVFRADHAFQAVLLPRAGSHDVVLEFDDPWLEVTHLGILAGVVLVTLPLLLGWLQRRMTCP